MQVSVLRRHLVVYGQADQMMTEHGPAIPGVDHQPGPDQRGQRPRRVVGPEPGHLGRHLRTEAPAEHAGGLKIGLAGWADTGEA